MGQVASDAVADSKRDNPNPNNPEVAWWFKLLTRVLAAIGGIVALITGIWVIISVTPRCIIGGILQMAFALLVLMCEAPFCCVFIKFVGKISTFADARTYWQKAIMYVIIALIPICLCPGLTSIFGNALIFITGVLYGLMSLGKKAERREMLANAQGRDAELESRFVDMGVNMAASQAAQY